MTRNRSQQEQTRSGRPAEGGAQPQLDQHRVHRLNDWRWHRVGRTVVIRAAALAVLVCASLVGAAATGHQAHAAPATADVANSASVTSINLSVSPASFVGVCSPTMTFTFTGTITVGPNYGGENIPYTLWVDGQQASATNAYTYGYPGASSVTATVTYSMSAAQGTGAVHTAYMNSLGVQSNGVQFSLTCITVSNVTLSRGVRLLCGLSYTATVTIAPSPGGTVTYTWQFVNSSNVSSSASGEFQAPADQATTQTVTYSPFLCHVPTSGTYGAILVVTAPNMVYSNPVIVHF